MDLPSIDEIRQMVDSSVKKEELIGTKKIVDVPQDQSGAAQDATTQDGTATVSETPVETTGTEENTPSESEGSI